MKKKQSHQLRSFGLALLLCLSFGSFLYINNVELSQCGHKDEVKTIYADDMHDADEVLPDIHIMKKVMHKAFEFII